MSDQKAVYVSVLMHLAIHMYEMHCWIMTQISYNYNGYCNYADRCPILPEGLDMVILKTSASDGSMSCAAGGIEFMLYFLILSWHLPNR
jgi:hypothetical protein